MKKPICFIFFFAAFLFIGQSQSVSVLFDNTSPIQNYAATTLQQSVLKKGYSIKKSGASYLINFLVNKKLGSEAYSLERGSQKITITGGDDKGILYGALSLAEDLRNGITLQNIKAKTEAPKLPFRAIKFDLP